jgi:FkbM family methyltransferase
MFIECGFHYLICNINDVMLKKSIKQVIEVLGFRLSRINTDAPVGSKERPVGHMDLLLEDLQHRGLLCASIIDVGANCAQWSRMAKKIFPDASFCLIEPQVEMQDQLESFCRDFKGSTFILAGAGAKNGVLTLTIWDDLAGSSLLVEPDQKLKDTGKQREIEIVTIDELIQTSKIKTPELIKLDIQGFELEALKGAELTFGKTEVYILETSLFSFSEVQALPILADVINFMHQRDYVVYDFAGFGRRPFDGALAQCDICFVKKNGFLRAFEGWT